ncbi:hypothetical protein [Wenxinia marina]|uniref:Secreted protein n=1 Tax=Wenxinia marina DSM 24838 TaxID=1123501 RepID=A0A0D0NNA1_9RHOB|nr:hypothetical protein [Wenxinia marina]KIQ69705.1 hypothetical protein Wenmar_02069 [Wenxinia marina DSM 24838]GGL60547.1 hypothetical protein GCM10011392_13760 [Wenxinia marina]
MRALLVLLALAAGPAAAEDFPWTGRWGGWECRDEVMIGSADLGRDGGLCTTTAIVPLGATGAVALRLDCGGAVEDVVLMYNQERDALWLWESPDQIAPRRLRRCDAP